MLEEKVATVVDEEVPLTVEERLLFTELERTVKRGEKWIRRAAKALVQIRDQKLYRDSYRSFTLYCLEVLGMEYQVAESICTAGRVLLELEKSQLSHVLPVRQSQMLALAKLSPDEQRLAWQRSVAISDGNQPEISIIKAEVDNIRILGYENCVLPMHGDLDDVPELRRKNLDRRRQYAIEREDFRIVECAKKLRQAQTLIQGLHAMRGTVELTEAIEKIEAARKKAEELPSALRAIRKSQEVGAVTTSA